ncbi:MAG: hypothetical protein ACWGQW_19595, partial [bacterium]
MYSGYSEPYSKVQDRHTRITWSIRLGVDWYGHNLQEMIDLAYPEGCHCNTVTELACPYCLLMARKRELEEGEDI